jgi:hypothetical protein
MIGLARLVRASLRTLVTDRGTWFAYAAVVLVTTVVSGLALTGVESAGGAPAPLGGIVRSWTTPAAFMAVVAGTTCLASVSRLTQSQFDPTRLAWVPLGVLPWQGRALIALETAVVTVAATTGGLAIVIVTAMALNTLTTPWGSLVLTTGPLVTVGTPVVVALSLTPALVGATRRFPPRPRRVRLGGGLGCAIPAAAVVVLLALMPSAPTRDDDVAELVPWSLLLVVLGSVAASTIGPAACRLVTAGLDRALTGTRWNVLRLAFRAVADGVRRDGAGLSVPMVGVAVPGGLTAVFLAGDEALRTFGSLASSDATINWPAVTGLAAAPAVLAAVAGSLLFSLSAPIRRDTGRALLAAGASPAALRAIASFEAVLLRALGTLGAVTVVAVSASPLLCAAHADLGTWAVVTLNPVMVCCSGLALVALVIGSSLGRRS